MKGILCFFVGYILFRIAVTDYHTMMIPPKYNFMLFLAGLFQLYYEGNSLIMYLAGCFFFMLFLGLFFKVSKGTLLGGGDVKLMAAAGLLLGLYKSLMAFFIGCFLALIVESILTKRKRSNGLFPMAPYLCASIFLMFLYR